MYVYRGSSRSPTNVQCVCVYDDSRGEMTPARRKLNKTVVLCSDSERSYIADKSTRALKTDSLSGGSGVVSFELGVMAKTNESRTAKK